MRGTTNVPESSVIIRNEKGQILFIQRQHTKYEDGKYCLPAGHVEHGESFSTAAIREVKEEVDITVQPEDLFPVFSMQRRANDDDIRVGIVFEARAWSGTPKSMEPERHGPVTWFDAEDLPFDKIMQFQADALRAIAAGSQYIETGW
jgi:mutator protein MutT